MIQSLARPKQDYFNALFKPAPPNFLSLKNMHTFHCLVSCKWPALLGMQQGPAQATMQASVVERLDQGGARQRLLRQAAVRAAQECARAPALDAAGCLPSGLRARPALSGGCTS